MLNIENMRLAEIQNVTKLLKIKKYTEGDN